MKLSRNNLQAGKQESCNEMHGMTAGRKLGERRGEIGLSNEGALYMLYVELVSRRCH